MKKITIKVYFGSKSDIITFTVAENATPQEIEAVKEAAFFEWLANQVDYGWHDTEE